MSLQKISILYPYFVPGYKAGGITQSLYNLSVLLSETYQIQVVCLDHDFCDNIVYPFIEQSGRTKEIHTNVTVEYLDKNNYFKEALKKIQSFSPDFIYVNSIYDYGFLSLGIFAAKKLNVKIVIAPRGMLHDGGLKKGTIKKSVYLKLLSGYLKLNKSKVVWHATDDQEVEDIKKWFHQNPEIHQATDTPRPIPQTKYLPNYTSQDTVRLVYYSLITSKKNLHLLLQALQLTKQPFSLDVYGPIIEEEYWQQCQETIKQLSHPITYKGKIEFAEFAKIAHQYHFLVLPSKGENFGHVIYESLSLGLPILISKFTPWKFEEGSIGFYVNLQPDDIAQKLEHISKKIEQDYNKLTIKAKEVAIDFYNSMAENCQKKYGKIFHL